MKRKFCHSAEVRFTDRNAEFLEEAAQPGQFSYRMYYRGLGIRKPGDGGSDFYFRRKKFPSPEVRQNASGRTRRLFFRKSVFQKMQGFSRLLLGDKSGLSEELRERFQDNGIALIWQSAGFMSL